LPQCGGGSVLRANIAYRRLTGPAGGSDDASILAFLRDEEKEAARQMLRALGEANRTRSMRLKFVIGRDTRTIEASFNWVEDERIVVLGRDVTEKDRVERDRLEAAAARQVLEQSCEIGHWRAASDKRVLISPGAARLMGLDPAGPAPSASDLLDMVVEEDRAAAAAAVRAAAETRKALRFDCRLRRPDGQVRRVRVAGSPSLNAYGQLEALHGVIADRTEPDAALKVVLNADTTVRRIFDTAMTGMILCDTEMRIIYLNDRVLKDLNLSPTQMQSGGTLYDLVPWTPEKWRRAHRQALKGEVVQAELDEVDLPDGSRRYMRWTCAPWRDGPAGAVGDVTTIARLRHEAETSRERLTLGLGLAAAMIWELNFELREVHVEGDWRAFFRNPPTFDTLAGGDPSIHPGDREGLAAQWRAHLAGGPPYETEYRVTDEAGAVRWHSASVRILRTVKGAPAKAIVSVRDITDRKQDEAKAADAERRALIASAAKSEFLSNMSHEIRTPLNGVLAVSEMLSRSNLDERQGEMVKLITTSGRTLLKVMDDLVEYSRLEADRIEFDIRPFDLETALNTICDGVQARAEAKGLAFTRFLSASLDGVFRGDPERIGQVVGNLLNNAVKFTETGSISLSATVEDTESRSLVTITIADTGVGFAPAVAERIFDGFEQADLSTSRKFGGLGLGLSIVKRLVDHMGGTIRANSEEGVGSTFEVTLPLARDRIAALGHIKSVEVEDFDTETTIQSARLLVAEDNPMNRRVVELLLAQSGVEIAFAENGREAVEKAKLGGWDLLLMDLQMPIMGGLEAMRVIRQWESETGQAHLPIIAVSANATDEHVREAMDAGADDHVAKPIVRESLFDAIARYAKPSQRAAAASRNADDFDLDALDLDLDIAVQLAVHPVGDEVVHDRRIGERRDVAKASELVLRDLAQDAAHDLA
jgi:two-component system, sensor histidine kinase